MLVENVVAFAHQKFANMCAHIEQAHGLDMSEMRAIPATALYVLLKQHLLPHAALVEAGDAAGLLDAIDNEALASMPVHTAISDAKVMRYLKLFCELVA